MSCSENDEKVMFKWAKSVLIEADVSIRDITDFSDGIKLARLVECLIGVKAFPQIRQRDKSTFIHNVENINIVLQALEKNGLKLYGIDPYEIAKGKVKTLVILLWNLGRRYGVHNQIDEMKTLFGGIKWTKPEWANEIWDCEKLSTSTPSQKFAVSSASSKLRSSESNTLKPKEDDKEKQYVREMIGWINTMVEKENRVHDIKNARIWKVVANVIKVLTKCTQCADYQSWTGTDEECMSRVLDLAEEKMHVPKLFEASEANSINDVSWLLYYGSFVRYAVRQLQKEMSDAAHGFSKVDSAAAARAEEPAPKQAEARLSGKEGRSDDLKEVQDKIRELLAEETKAEEVVAEKTRQSKEEKCDCACAVRNSSEEASCQAKRSSDEKKRHSGPQEKRRSAEDGEKGARRSGEKKNPQQLEQSDGYNVQGWGLQARGVRATENARFEISVPTGKQDQVEVKISGSKGLILKQLVKHVDPLTRVEPNTFALSAASIDSDSGTAVIQCMYNVTEPDDYEVTVKCGGLLMPKCPLKVNVVEWRESFVKVYGDGLSAAIVNKPACFLLEMNGEFGLVEVAIDGPKIIEISVNKLSGETYAVRYLPDERGEYLVHIKHNEKEIESSPHSLNIIDTVTDDFDLENVQLIDFDAKSVKVNCLHSFTVQVKRTTNVYPIAVRIWSCGIAVQCCDVSVLVDSVENRRSGVNFDVYMCTWKPVRAGQHVLTVAYNRVLVFEAPKLINVRG